MLDNGFVFEHITVNVCNICDILKKVKLEFCWNKYVKMVDIYLNFLYNFMAGVFVS